MDDDPFAAVHDMDEECVERGRELGRKDGRKQGIADGMAEGRRKIHHRLAKDMGFILGVTTMFITMLGSSMKERTRSHLDRLQSLIHQFESEVKEKPINIELISDIHTSTVQEYKAFLSTLEKSKKEDIKRLLWDPIWEGQNTHDTLEF